MSKTNPKPYRWNIHRRKSKNDSCSVAVWECPTLKMAIGVCNFFQLSHPGDFSVWRHEYVGDECADLAPVYCVPKAMLKKQKKPFVIKLRNFTGFDS